MRQIVCIEYSQMTDMSQEAWRCYSICYVRKHWAAFEKNVKFEALLVRFACCVEEDVTPKANHLMRLHSFGHAYPSLTALNVTKSFQIFSAVPL